MSQKVPTLDQVNTLPEHKIYFKEENVLRLDGNKSVKNGWI